MQSKKSELSNPSDFSSDLFLSFGSSGGRDSNSSCGGSVIVISRSAAYLATKVIFNYKITLIMVSLSQFELHLYIFKVHFSVQ